MGMGFTNFEIHIYLETTQNLLISFTRFCNVGLCTISYHKKKDHIVSAKN